MPGQTFEVTLSARADFDGEVIRALLNDGGNSLKGILSELMPGGYCVTALEVKKVEKYDHMITIAGCVEPCNGHALERFGVAWPRDMESNKEEAEAWAKTHDELIVFAECQCPSGGTHWDQRMDMLITAVNHAA